MAGHAKKIILPCLEITEVSVSPENREDAVPVVLPLSDGNQSEIYHIQPKVTGVDRFQRDGNPTFVYQQYNFFPVVLDKHGVPWAEANMYLLTRVEGVVSPVMTTFSSIADDLAAYQKFLDETGLDWTHFPSQKLSRPTYRFNGYLKYAVGADEIAAATAHRRMGSVIGFYRWLSNEKVLIPANPPWKESDRYIDFRDSHGFERSKKVVTTDISIKIPKQNDPYDGAISDGGKLRPLSREEQMWVMEALIASGNTEMTLIHLFGFITGARIQTILTFRVHQVLEAFDWNSETELRIPIGPGTGIDTKNNKQMVLHIPIWFYQMLHTYCHSQRARKRRERANGGDNEKQYLFLSVKGTPLYQSKAESRLFKPTNKIRHIKTGQNVRQFITERIIPFVRNKYGVKTFHYQFHDTRATAGMNWTDHQLALVEQGKVTLMQVREFVKTRMGHESTTTTDRYLQYRNNMKIVSWAGQNYESHLMKLSEMAMQGLI